MVVGRSVVPTGTREIPAAYRRAGNSGRVEPVSTGLSRRLLKRPGGAPTLRSIGTPPDCRE